MPVELPTHLPAEGEVWAKRLIANFGFFSGKVKIPPVYKPLSLKVSFSSLGGPRGQRTWRRGKSVHVSGQGPLSPALSLSKGGRMASVLAGGCQGQVLLGRSLLSLSQTLWEERDPFDRRTTTEFECYLYVLPRATSSNHVDP